jgi:hypothetical protein
VRVLHVYGERSYLLPEGHFELQTQRGDCSGKTVVTIYGDGRWVWYFTMHLSPQASSEAYCDRVCDIAPEQPWSL